MIKKTTNCLSFELESKASNIKQLTVFTTLEDDNVIVTNKNLYL